LCSLTQDAKLVELETTLKVPIKIVYIQPPMSIDKNVDLLF